MNRLTDVHYSNNFKMSSEEQDNENTNQYSRTKYTNITVNTDDDATGEDIRVYKTFRKYSMIDLIMTRISWSVLSALFYGLSSFIIMVVNKSILTNFKFPSAQFLGICQMMTTILVLYLCKCFNAISFPDFSFKIPFQIWPLPLFYFGNLVFGLSGTKNLSLPMFVVLRRFSILLTLIGECVFLGIRPKISVTATVIAMILGAIVAASDDLAFDLFGYIYVISNDFMTAATGIWSKKKLDAKELGKHGILFYNSLFMLLPACVIASCTGNIAEVKNFEQWSSSTFMLMFCASCTMGFVLMYATLLCTAYNSPLTTTVIGCLKNVLITYVGMVVGGDYIFSFTNFIGVNISVVGSLLYTYVTFFKTSSTKNHRLFTNL